MKKVILPILFIFLITYSCKVQQSALKGNNNETPFYGAFSQNELEWYLNLENTINSNESNEKVSYYRMDYEANSMQFFRTEHSDFQPSPIVNYIYDNATKKIKEIHYEWDITNYLTKEEKSKVRIESEERAEEFITHFENLSSIITKHIGKKERQGNTKADSLLTYKYIEATDSWESSKLKCELYMIFSNHYEEKGIIKIIPTHRIRCKFIWN